ncbi:MAG: phospholipase D family protein, partial [Dehalococcoidia bacterium]
LEIFAQEFKQSQVFCVPRLHAKVYIADTAKAIIGSANLTTSALDQNKEYGVLIDDASIVRQIEDDMWRFARLGSSVELGVLNKLKEIADTAKSQSEVLQRSANVELQRRFKALLTRAHQSFVATQVGTRSANAVFSEAIMYVLAEGRRTTRDLHPRLQSLLPDLCDDSTELIINGEAFGKKWKHHVRNAQQSLKRAGHIQLDGTVWRRTGA